MPNWLSAPGYPWWVSNCLEQRERLLVELAGSTIVALGASEPGQGDERLRRPAAIAEAPPSGQGGGQPGACRRAVTLRLGEGASALERPCPGRRDLVSGEGEGALQPGPSLPEVAPHPPEVGE
jgi:hypothetical protein